MVNSHNLSKKCARKSHYKGLLNPKPRGVARGVRSVRTIGVTRIKSNHSQVIFHNRSAKNHTVVFDIGAQ